VISARATLLAFKTTLKRGDAPGSVMLRKQFGAVTDPLQDRRLGFTISTGTIDRQGDTIAVAGWDLRNYLRNPVVLWGHDADELPIARCVSIDVSGNALKAVVEFVPADMPVVGDLSEAILRMCRSGFLSATSVGFQPLEFEIATDRDDEDSWFPPVNFLRQELLEFSIVAIPANAEALIDPADRLLLAQAPPALRHAGKRPLTTLQALILGHTAREIAAMRVAGQVVR
jgi:HK97 family phage prohead protease